MIFPDYQKKGGRILEIEVRNMDHDLPEGRTWLGPQYNMPRETPVRNLYNVGDAVMTPGLGGTSACAEAAKRVVEAVKKRVKAE